MKSLCIVLLLGVFITICVLLSRKTERRPVVMDSAGTFTLTPIAEYDGKLYEIPQIVIPIPNELRPK